MYYYRLCLCLLHVLTDMRFSLIRIDKIVWATSGTVTRAQLCYYTNWL
jgi:hypothetical protein